MTRRRAASCFAEAALYRLGDGPLISRVALDTVSCEIDKTKPFPSRPDFCGRLDQWTCYWSFCSHGPTPIPNIGLFAGLVACPGRCIGRRQPAGDRQRADHARDNSGGYGKADRDGDPGGLVSNSPIDSTLARSVGAEPLPRRSHHGTPGRPPAGLRDQHEAWSLDEVS